MVVLIIDNIALARTILTNILVQECGLHKTSIHEASSASVAINSFRTLKPDVVFMDVNLPDKSGKQITEDILKIDPNAYIIMCSSVAEKATVRDCVIAGAKDYILKPLDPSRVKLALEKGGINLDEI
jgi:two-component system chemotaxis response regulator CheY